MSKWHILKSQRRDRYEIIWRIKTRPGSAAGRSKSALLFPLFGIYARSRRADNNGKRKCSFFAVYQNNAPRTSPRTDHGIRLFPVVWGGWSHLTVCRCDRPSVWLSHVRNKRWPLHSELWAHVCCRCPRTFRGDPRIPWKAPGWSRKNRNIAGHATQYAGIFPDDPQLYGLCQEP